MRQAPMRMGMGPPMTPLTRDLLIALLALFVIQLLAENWLGLPVLAMLAWWPFGSGSFHPWQPLTAFLINGPSPVEALLDWLMIYFFAPTAQDAFGSRGFLRAMGFTAIFSIVAGLALLAIGAVGTPTPFLGLNPFITALIVLFGLSRPNAQILLFFVLPIKAGWVAWGTGLLAALTFLFSRDLGSALWLSGWLAGYLWLELQLPGGLRRPILRLQQWWLRRKLRRFKVIDGGRRDPDDLVH